jgi:hypothetical protein
MSDNVKNIMINPPRQKNPNIIADTTLAQTYFKKNEFINNKIKIK